MFGTICRCVIAGLVALSFAVIAPQAIAQDKEMKGKGKTKTPKTESKPAVDKSKKSEDPKANETKARATGNPEFEIYKDRGGKFRFRLKDADGSILCGKMGPGYETKEQCMKSVEQIRKIASSAKIDDQAK